MSTQAHTEGPWTVTTEGVSGRRIFMPDDTVEIRGKDGRGLIACLYLQNWAGKQDEANARLIAAAPDMLAVLNAARIMLKNRDQRPEEMKLLDAIKVVVAKAEGRAP